MIYLSDITSLNIFFGWLSIVSTTLFLWATLSLKRTNHKIRDIKDQEEKRWQEGSDKAQKDYQDIIATANKKAVEITLRATQISHESIVNLQNSLSEMAQNQQDAFKQISLAVSKKHEDEVNKINDENIKILINIYKDIQNSARSDFAKYKEAVQKQTFEAEKIAEERIKDDYEKLKIEVGQLRLKKLEELESNIDNIILNISKDVIGRSLNLSDHQDLIMRALEEAKKEEIL